MPSGENAQGTCSNANSADKIRRLERELKVAQERIRQLGDERTLTDTGPGLEASAPGEERLQLFIEHAPSAMAMFDREMRYLYASRRWRSDFGLGETELSGVSHYAIFPEMPEKWREAHRRAMAGEVLSAEADRFERANGSLQWVKWEIQPWSLPDGEIGGIVIFTEDVTETKLAVETLRESEARYRELVQNANSAILRWSNDGLITFFNEYAQTFFGWSADEALGQPVTILVPEQETTGTDLSGLVQNILDSPEDFANVINQNRCRDGRRVWMSWTNHALRNKRGEVVEILAVGSDISGRIAADEELQHQQRLLSEAEALSHTGAWEWDLASDHWVFSEEWSAIHGCRKRSLTSREFLAIVHPGDRELVQGALDALRRGVPYDLEHRVVREDDGTVRIVHARGQGLKDAAGQLGKAYGFAQDITGFRQAEEGRRRALVFAETLFEQSPTGIRVFEGETGFCIRANQAAADIAGGRVDMLLAQNFRELESWRDAGLVQVAENVLHDGVDTLVEADLNTSFGRQVAVQYQFSRFFVEGKPHLLIIGRDVTEEKRRAEERRHIEEQMLHVQKLESLGILAGGIAHDFNNILMAVMGNADLALRRLSPESPVVSYLQQVQAAASKATDLAHQMLAYSGRGKFVVESLDINRVIEEMMHMLEVSISKKAHLRFNFSEDLPAVEADATQLRQVIMNLVINASEAIGEKSGVIAISTGAFDCDVLYLRETWLDEGLSEGLYVYFEVADTGCGMDQSTITRIFDPFFTTKFTGRGLGMAAVLGIVRGHKGAIKVYSEVGKGTTFKVLMPAASRPARIFDETRSEPPWSGAGIVLLVDDEDTVRAVGKAMLGELGFEVITADNGKEAVALFRQRRQEITVVLMDLTMPHMGGEDAFREMRRIDPEVKVIITSGYNEQEVAPRFIGKRLSGFLQKPFRLSVLREALRAIDNRPSD